MSGQLDEAAVRHVAHLARLKITDEEVSRYAKQLSRILEYVALLNEIDTEGVEPTAHPLSLGNVMRDDAEGATLSPEQATANAPQRKDGFFRVPKVLDHSDG
ncbi:MAG: Asp-tRNA(Asn)/Glu-tRNA(Gln) amidotransferase subunit GatC [Phycisphaerae bacterium]|nr:Asp-tRNA(Asn)/Glu-tRNA(Gln) amidotransferase subunit GatC [Phycisphaerae bacterium]